MAALREAYRTLLATAALARESRIARKSPNENLTRTSSYLSDCRRVIDIGGQRNPLSIFSAGRRQSVVTLDPFTFSLYRKDHDRELVQLKIRCVPASRFCVRPSVRPFVRSSVPPSARPSARPCLCVLSARVCVCVCKCLCLCTRTPVCVSVCLCVRV
jgi:hypothetical protein